MKVDIVIVQLAIIFLPGLLWAGLDARYALKSKPSDFQYLLRAFLFGIASYGVTFAIYSALGWPITIVDLSEVGVKSVFSGAVFKEIAFAVMVGILLAVLWVYASTYKIDTRILQKIKATKKYGDEDVWDYTFNSSAAAVEYVQFRDFENKLVYAGWVQTFSETEKLRELVLRNVQVFNFESELQFEMPLMYVARKPENIHIEFPYTPP